MVRKPKDSVVATETAGAAVAARANVPARTIAWTSTEVAAAITREDAKLLSRSVLLEETNPPAALTIAVRVMAGLVAVFLLWASLSTFAEKAVAPGEVLPSMLTLPVQTKDGGIVSDVMVQEGEEVKIGQVLMRLTDTELQARYDGQRARVAALAMSRERQLALAEGRDPRFDRWSQDFPGLVADARQAYEAAKATQDARIGAAHAVTLTREAEVAGYTEEVAALGIQVRALKESLEMRQALLKRGTGSRGSVLDAETEYGREAGELAARKTSLARAEAGLIEARSNEAATTEGLRRDALEAAASAGTELAIAEDSLRDLTARVERLSVRASLNGRVNGLVATRAGAVVAPGTTLLTLVPSHDVLVAEVKVSTRDVGHIKQGMPVLIRVDSYKYGRYGGIDGRVDRVSPDTFDAPDGSVYYKARVVLEKNYVGTDPASNQIVPGMTVTADIQTGEKSLMGYLIRPIRTSLATAFAER
ncbi:HlyD family type I secretion periplasmic adaptor subunit [Gimibacter soli]|uniref:Membrane fusion protein (MFP) family protein n=1 Tax=Gimibacter soli TaxID=3024400 RepID=A0AAF0BKT8_9PROT|nr:HlyD family type I secretion periplasmic adaptor subunit [Gimibacter soli]WCL54659.1 HlyD family type I secretion periplasmic adaptor subunit [Gimibacter soli]